MNEYKVELWEQVTVWQKVKVVIKAESKEDLDQKLKGNCFLVEDCYDADPDWNTEFHVEYDTNGYALLDEDAHA